MEGRPEDFITSHETSYYASCARKTHFINKRRLLLVASIRKRQGDQPWPSLLLFWKVQFPSGATVAVKKYFWKSRRFLKVCEGIGSHGRDTDASIVLAVAMTPFPLLPVVRFIRYRRILRSGLILKLLLFGSNSKYRQMLANGTLKTSF